MITSNHHQKCIESAMNQAEKLCARNKLQFTKLRKSVFTIIWQSHNPLKAYDILQQLQKNDAAAKPITVYRALDFLLNNHMIHKLESENTFFGCTHPGKTHNCYFLICKKCHIVQEGCKNDILKDIYNHINQDNFKIEYVTLEIQGICQNCSK